MSKFAGSLLRISAATSSSVSSLDLPPPLDVRAYGITCVQCNNYVLSAILFLSDSMQKMVYIH